MVEEREAGGVHMKPRRANFIGCLTASSSPACHLFCFCVRPYILDDDEAQTQESQTAEHLDSLPSDYILTPQSSGRLERNACVDHCGSIFRNDVQCNPVDRLRKVANLKTLEQDICMTLMKQMMP